MHCHQQSPGYSRRDFLTKTSLGLGALTLGSLLAPVQAWGKTGPGNGGVLGQTHFAPKAKRIIYLFQSGAPSQLDLFDYKPLLNQRNGEELPESIRKGQRLTGMTAGQASFPLAGSIFKFQQHGQSGAWVSELMPHTAKVVDELCFVKSMYTEAINHDPAATFIQTGSQLPGRPSMGAWISYGLGSDNENLPAFVVLVTKDKFGQPLYARLWGNGFLPSQHQGVQFRPGKNPVLYLANPPGVSGQQRKEQLDYLAQLEQLNHQDLGDPEILARMAQYEMAFRMQTSVPEIMDISGEPDYIYELYGPDSRKPGTFAANCLLARRLAERNVKFIQLYHQGWDQHGNLPAGIKTQCKETDQPTAALITDLKQRGMLEDTLVIWGGEFGRTNYSQGKLTPTNYGRDHHPKCYTLFMAGAGVKKGFSYGATDDFGYNIVQNPVHIHDFQATIMQLLGIDHERLTFKFQGRRYRLTDVHGKVVRELLS
ncbi:MAG: DUF1501 domain-containing protein [Bacteroidetes bacterium]|nr:MAG: DUF1501 domain-containing protein [Bacteroidota bacterium]